MTNYKADYHVHSYYSDDSEYEMEEVIKKAISLGIDELCFTDHVDYGVKSDHGKPCPTGVYNVDYPAYFKEIKQLKEKYKDQIIIRQGLEFGIQTHTINKYEALYDQYEFDFILLSIHQVHDREFWRSGDEQHLQYEDYMEYYNELLECMKKFMHYSVLSHLDMIVRHDINKAYPLEKIKPIITEILQLAIKEGKGIEINTSSHRYHVPDTTPSIDILKLYKELGGTIITIGSDSHKEEHLYAYIDESKALLKELGFETFCTFDHMKPIYHKL